MKNGHVRCVAGLLVFALAAVSVLAGCTPEDGTLVIFNDSSPSECTASWRLNAGEDFTLAPGDSETFTLEPGVNQLSLAGPPPSGCAFTGDFASTSSCTFTIVSEETSIIRIIDESVTSEQIELAVLCSPVNVNSANPTL